MLADCLVGIIPIKSLALLNDDDNKDDKDVAALLAILGWLQNMSDCARCIGCDKPFGKIKAKGFAVFIPQPLTDVDHVVSAGICGKCMSHSYDDLRNSFKRALGQDHIATITEKGDK